MTRLTIDRRRLDAFFRRPLVQYSLSHREFWCTAAAAVVASAAYQNCSKVQTCTIRKLINTLILDILHLYSVHDMTTWYSNIITATNRMYETIVARYNFVRLMVGHRLDQHCAICYAARSSVINGHGIFFQLRPFNDLFQFSKHFESLLMEMQTIIAYIPDIRVKIFHTFVYTLLRDLPISKQTYFLHLVIR